MKIRVFQQSSSGDEAKSIDNASSASETTILAYIQVKQTPAIEERNSVEQVNGISVHFLHLAICIIKEYFFRQHDNCDMTFTASTFPVQE